MASSASRWSTPAPTSVAPARFGDVVELASQVSEFRRSSFDVAHELFVRGELAVEGRETRVWAGRDEADTTRLEDAADSERGHRAVYECVTPSCLRLMLRSTRSVRLEASFETRRVATLLRMRTTGSCAEVCGTPI